MELTTEQIKTIEALDRSFGYDSQAHSWEWDTELEVVRFTRKRHPDGRTESAEVDPIMLEETLAEWREEDREAGRE